MGRPYYFDYSYLILNFNLSDNTAEKIVEVKDGWVKVAGQGMDYKLEFYLTITENKTIRGSYGLPFENMNSSNSQAQSPMSRGIDVKKIIPSKADKK